MPNFDALSSTYLLASRELRLKSRRFYVSKLRRMIGEHLTVKEVMATAKSMLSQMVSGN